MVALLVFILAYNGDLTGKKIIMETFSKVRPKPETAHEKPLAPRVERFCLLEMFWFANQNKQLPNHDANLESRDARLVIMKFMYDSRE